MERWRGKVAMVTGASAGIGAAISRTLVCQGLQVVGLARREDRLRELAEGLSKESGKLYPIKTDLQKEDDIMAAFAWVEKELGGADILVNNAGLYLPSYLTDGRKEDWRAMFEVNVLAVTLSTQLLLKGMEQRNNQTGHIFFINSTSGHLAEQPLDGIYCGTKHAVKAISMCLRRELAEKNSTIKVTSISPGVVDTEIYKGTHWEESIKATPMLQGDDVAAAVVDALSASPISQICEIVLNPVPTKLDIY